MGFFNVGEKLKDFILEDENEEEIYPIKTKIHEFFIWGERYSVDFTLSYNIKTRHLIQPEEIPFEIVCSTMLYGEIHRVTIEDSELALKCLPEGIDFNKKLSPTVVKDIGKYLNKSFIFSLLGVKDTTLDTLYYDGSYELFAPTTFLDSISIDYTIDFKETLSNNKIDSDKIIEDSVVSFLPLSVMREFAPSLNHSFHYIPGVAEYDNIMYTLLEKDCISGSDGSYTIKTIYFRENEDIFFVKTNYTENIF